MHVSVRILCDSFAKEIHTLLYLLTFLSYRLFFDSPSTEWPVWLTLLRITVLLINKYSPNNIFSEMSFFFSKTKIPEFSSLGRVFTNGLGDLGSILGHVIPKWCLIPPCLTLSNIRYVSRVK